MNNVEEIKKEQCCGCTACFSICPKHAIVMIADDEGFIYPKVDIEKCIHCGLCVTVCKNKSEEKKGVLSAIAAKNTDEKVLKKSSSGGVANALCKKIISQGGTVYGVKYDDNFKVITERADTYEKCEPFYGSKYVQTDPTGCFEQVAQDLKNCRPVLFFGTSCHVAGLEAYLEKNNIAQNNLYTVDLICHGVPSPRIFADYISFLKLKKGFKSFEFRTKNFPWGYGSRNYGCTIYYDSRKEEINTAKAKLFLNLFFSNNCLRPHCHECEFAGINKPADITVADYWGLKDAHPDFFDEKGVSAVLIHSKKGEELLKSIDNLTTIETTVEKISKKQGNLTMASKVSPQRVEFWKLYNEQGFMAIAKKYGGWNLKGKIKGTKLFKKFDDCRHR